MAGDSNMVRCTDCALLFLQPTARRQTRTARVEELLNVNHPPLDVELPLIRSDMACASASLQDLDVKIVRAKGLLDALLSTREQAHLHLADVKSVLHPLRSIPSELLLEIFSYCIPRVEYSSDTDALHPRRAPWVLTRVCRRWRELVINSPRLWTQLLIDFDKPAVSTLYAHRASLFLERSRGIPMDIYLGSTDPVSNQWLTVLEKGISHCRFLHVNVPPSSLQCLLQRSFPRLQTLVVLKSRRRNSDIAAHPSIMAPVLRELEVLSSDSWENLALAAIPFPQLTTLRNFSACDAAYLPLLPNLEDLSVSVDDTPIRRSFALPKLRRLTMLESDSAVGGSQEFFAALQIPALVDLTLEFSEDVVTLFPTMSSTSPLGNLTKLDISCDMNAHEENTEHLLDFLALTQRVEWLRIYDLGMTVEFINGLSLRNGGSVRLPCLLFLDIGDSKCAGAPGNDIKPLVDMLHSRLPRDATKEGGNADSVYQQNSVTTGVVAVSAPESRPESRFLETVHLPRHVYVEMRNHWPDTCLEMRRKVKLACGVTMSDDP